MPSTQDNHNNSGWKLSGTIFVLASSLATQGLMFLTAIVLARVLSKADLGVYSIVIQIQNILVLALPLAIPLALTSIIAKEQKAAEKVAHLMTTSLQLAAITTVIFGSAFVVINLLFAESIYGTPRITQYLILVLIGAILTSQFQIARGGLHGLKQMQVPAVAITLGSLAGLLAMPLAVVYGLSGALGATIIGGAVSLIIVAIGMKRTASSLTTEHILKKISLIDLGDLSKIALPLFGSSVVLFVALLIARTVLQWQGGFDEVGNFQIANNIIQAMTVIPIAIATIALPATAKLSTAGDSESASIFKFVKEAFSKSSTTAAIMVVLVTSTIYLIPIIYGRQYDEAMTAVMLIALAYGIIAPFAATLNQVLISENRTVLRMIIDVVVGLLIILGTYLLGKNWGASGLALSYGLAYTGAAVWMACLYHKKTGWNIFLRHGLLSIILALQILSFYTDYFIIATCVTILVVLIITKSDVMDIANKLLSPLLKRVRKN